VFLERGHVGHGVFFAGAIMLDDESARTGLANVQAGDASDNLLGFGAVAVCSSHGAIHSGFLRVAQSSRLKT